MEATLTSFAARKGLDASELLFCLRPESEYFQHRVLPKHTPAQLKMKSGDGIRVFPNSPLTIMVQEQSGEGTFFKKKSLTKMKTLFNTFAARKGLNARDLRFMWGGERIGPDDTPLSLDVYDHDQIDVLPVQWGR
mmetsp:Transcript_14848/g.25355  ORF Transcript_14848/g.25355 Transcript_14848/m.25355 type:complete len:135 (+) Transcript_14848:142-546(+)